MAPSRPPVSNDPQFVEERTRQLQEYINDLLMLPDIGEVSQMAEFLEIGQHLEAAGVEVSPSTDAVREVGEETQRMEVDGATSEDDSRASPEADRDSGSGK